MTRAELIQFINANIYPNGRNQITAPMVRDSILAVVGFLGDAAVKDIGAVLENNTDLVTGGAVYDAIRAYLSSVMKMVGETTTDVITNPTANPVYVDGEPHTAQKGDVVVYGYKEFWWTGSIWKELGDEASWALKTISITGTGDLTGGGTLEANRTLDLTQSAKDKLAHGETAFSWLESYSTNRLRLKSPYSYLNARKGLILEEETDYTNTPADFVKQVVTVGETEYTILRSKLPIVSDSFISAGGISPGGGASGTTLQAVWDSLTTNTGDYANAKIHSGHIPLGSGLGVDGSGNIYVTSQGTVTGIKIGSTTYTPSAGSTIVDISSGIPTSMAWSAITSTPTTLAGYGITDAKIESGVITLGSSTITPLTSHQTIYNLVINNSAGTAQITYKPNVSGTYSLTLTSAMVGLGNVENTALSTWAGTSNITTLGTISTGAWQGTAIGYNYVAAHYIGRTRTTASAAQATLLGIDAISNASSSGSSDASRIVWDSTNNAWHFLGGIYADSFISAGGLSSGGGTPGIDLAAMWASLQNNDNVDTYDSYKFATAHLPALTANNGLTASYGSTTSGSGLADTLTIGVGSSYKLPLLTEWNAKADVSALANYLPLTGGTMSNTNVVTNLNADLLDGLHGGRFLRKNLIYASADCNTMEDNSFTILDQDAISLTCANKPSEASIAGGYGVLTVKHGGYRNQLFFPYTGDGDVFTRSSTYDGGVVWKGWQKIYHSGNLTKSVLTGLLDASGGYYLPLTGGASYPMSDDLVLKYNATTQFKGILFITSDGTEQTRIGSLSGAPVFRNSAGTYYNIYHSGNFVAGTNYQAPISGGTGISISGATVSVGSRTYTARGVSTSSIASSIPTKAELQGLGGTSGSFQVTYPGASGHLIQFCTEAGSARYVQMYTSYDSGVYWRQSINASLDKDWRLIYDSGNSNKSHVDWTCANLAANGYVTFYDSTSHNYRWNLNFNGTTGRLYAINDAGTAYNDILINNTITVTSGYTVGIGTTTPSYKLEVNGSAYASSLTLNGAISGATSIDSLLYFDTTNSRVGIGTASPDKLLSLYSNTESIIQMMSDGVGGDVGAIYIHKGAGNGFTFGEVNRDFVWRTGSGAQNGGGGGTERMRLTNGGNLTVTGAVTAGSASDVRLKTNIITLSDEQAKALIMALRPVTFTWNQKATELYGEYKGNDLGFIAQEVEPLLPMAISTIFNDYKRLDQTKFIAPLVAVAQSHETRIQQLERESKEKDAKIAELENTIANLTN